MDFEASLLDWYRSAKRDLPWRNDPTPYHVWLSEIMLQQTRVEAVKDYYERFLNALPSIDALAAAPEEVVLKLWEGLGYYSRARNLQKAAKVLVRDYQGILPKEEKVLQTLPGIGSYTAAAIAAIAYQEKAIAMDGNLGRVYARLVGEKRSLSLPDTKETGRRYFEERLENRPGDFNQALMDLGELVCLPHGYPRCETCPFSSCCVAHQAHQELAYPVLDPAKKKKQESMTVLLFSWNHHYAIRQRPSQGLLANLYEFPHKEGMNTKKKLQEWLVKENLPYISIRSLGRYTHIFTHLTWKMVGYEIVLEKEYPQEGWLYVTPEEMKQTYAIPSAFRFYQDKIGTK